MKNRLIGGALAALVLLAALQVQAADNYVVKDGSGASITMKAKEVSGVKAVTHTVANSDGTTLIDPATAANQATLNGYVDGLETAIAATNTKLDSVITYIDGLETILGTVTGSPTANTLADRLKAINTTLGAPLQAGGNVAVTASALPTGAATETSTAAIGTILGAVTASPTANTIGDRLKTINATLAAGIDVNCTGCSGGGGGGAVTNVGTFAVQNTAATPSGANLIGRVGFDQTTPGTTNGVVVNSSALPTGAATQTTSAAILAKQPAVGTAGSSSADVITVQGVASGTPLIAATTIANPTSVLTRPANATAYAAGDLIASSTTAGSIAVPAITATRISTGSATIARLRLNSSVTTGWGGVNVQIDLWTAAPTFTNGDNGAYAVATGAAGYIGTATVSLTQYADGAVGTALIADGPINLKLASGSSIYGTFQILSVATPTSGQTFTLTAETVQN